MFEHHATIEIPDGRAFQVSNSFLVPYAKGGLTMLPDASIEHVFNKSTGVRQMIVKVPKEVIDRVPST
jgi:hypothetical protein